MLKATIQRERLTDDSHVYNVLFSDTRTAFPTQKFEAVSEKDAQELADKVLAAVRDHTVNEADNSYDAHY